MTGELTRGQMQLAQKLAATIPGLTLTQVVAAFDQGYHSRIIAWKRQAALLLGERLEGGRTS